MAPALVLAVIALGYLLGAIPIGVLACRPFGRDPREVGSGRTGGTNVYRTAGLPAAMVTILGDIAKGYAAVALADQAFFAATDALPEAGSLHPWALALAALAAIVGHNYSVFLGFRGGAGTGPNAGAALAFDPATGAIVLAVAAAFLLVVRIASLGSLAVSATILVAISYLVYQGAEPPHLLVYGLGQLLLVVWALRPNIARLLAGTERRIPFGKESAPE